ncbi:hypothetical protein [Ilumatobacter sp.]|uniref:hypothetical protein n=1 Tax=Ilumatobacter sp. TaxID=1967498 RepID=UPI003AF77F65
MSSTPVRDVLLPGSDRTALIQVIVVIAATVAITYLVRRERSLMLLSIGVGMCVLGLMALRTLH